MQGPHPFLPNLDEEIVKEMLKRVGASSVSDLFSDIPPEFALGRKLAIPEASRRPRCGGRSAGGCRWT